MSLSVMSNVKRETPLLAAPAPYRPCNVIGCTNRAWPGKSTCLHCAEEIEALNEHSRFRAEQWAKRRRKPTSRLNRIVEAVVALCLIAAPAYIFWPYVYATIVLWKHLFSN